MLATLGKVYASATRLRARLYAGGRLRRRLGRPVVSVGNLTLGGTGKTPCVEALARRLRRMGLKPAVLTRGYGRSSRGVVVVSAGRGPLVGWREAGDEAYLLATRLEASVVVAAANRHAAGRLAESAYGVDVHILDDGFQHLRLERDLDLLLIDASRDLASERTLPAGRLREPLAGLARADLMLLTRSHQARAEDGALEALLARYAPRAPVFRSRQLLKGWVEPGGARAGLERWKGARALVVSAIGNPAQFAADVASAGLEVAGERAFRDHHAYDGADLESLARAARAGRADVVVTTLKDLVRLEVLLADRSLGVPVAALEAELLLPEDPAFQDMLEAALGRKAA